MLVASLATEKVVREPVHVYILNILKGYSEKVCRTYDRPFFVYAIYKKIDTQSQ